MLLTSMEEVTMIADYSPGDNKLASNDKETCCADTSFLGESNNKMARKCKQAVEKKVLQNAVRGNKDRVDGSAESPSDSESNHDGKKKKKHRRRNRGGRNHRRWKPYDKMSWTEKQILEEKETRRATQKREEAFASGHPVAPYNTTQFLMDDHQKNEAISPDLHRYYSKESNSTDSSSDFYDEEGIESFQEKNFMETFNDIKMQEMMSKTKEDLVHNVIELEMKLEILEKKSKKMTRASKSDTSIINSISSNEENDLDYEEFFRLKEENERLYKENEILRQENCKYRKV